MPLQLRLDAPGVLYHVMARGLDRQRVFRDDRDRNDFLACVALLADERARIILANLHTKLDSLSRYAEVEEDDYIPFEEPNK